MERTSIISSDINVIQCLNKNTLNRNQYVYKFVELLASLDSPLSIALNGEWGSGKTFFVKEVKMILEKINGINHPGLNVDIPSRLVDVSRHIAVYYDAWSHDDDIDPILSLIYHVIYDNQIECSINDKLNLFNKVKAIVSLITNRDVKAFFESFNETDLFYNNDYNANLKSYLKQFFDELLAEKGERLVFFIDELDRCKPDYAILFLERIKHYFDDDRVTFVFSVNLGQLQHSIKKAYGNDFDAGRYIDKFFDFRMRLPDVTPEEYMEDYLALSNCYSEMYKIVGMKTANYFRFTLRECERFVILLKAAAKATNWYSNDKFGSNSNRFVITYIAPILLGLQMLDENKFHAFIQGEYFDPMREILLDPEVYSSMTRLYENNETMGRDKEIIDKTSGEVVSNIEQRLELIYKSIFRKVPIPEYGKEKIGDIYIYEESKKIVLEVVSLFSALAKYV